MGALDNRREEEFVFLRFADADISEAITALNEISDAKTLFVKLCLLKQAAISYVRPFKTCRGVFGNHHLRSKGLVPPHWSSLHKQLSAFRDEAFAHTDLRVR